MSLAVEEQLLIQCSRVNMSEEAITRASHLLQQDVDWDYILEVSIRHAVSPLFYYGLNQVSQAVSLEKRVPGQVMEELQKLYQSNRLRNRRLFQVIGEVVSAFQKAQIEAMGLKDVQLAREVYPDSGLRPMGDIDILVHQDDYDKAASCLAELGFTPLPSANTPYMSKYAWGQHFRRPTDEVWIDLQWNVMQIEWDICQEGSFDFEIDRMWRGAYAMTIDNYHILAPKPEDMLFHLCLHLEGHTYAELILFCDIVELLRHYDGQLDWEYFINITQKYKVESSVYYVLFLVQQLFNIPLPQFLLRDLEPTYFKANIFSPLFSNLTSLHVLLDEFWEASFLPDEVMAQFEANARRQAVGAMQLYKALDEIASDFSSDGAILILDGRPSEKIYPDPSLRPFEDINYFILENDLPRMHQVLTRCGFRPTADIHLSEEYSKKWEFLSKDPVLADEPTVMMLQVQIDKGLDYLFHQKAPKSTSRKEVALRLLKAKFRNQKDDSSYISAQINIIPFSPEEMLLYLSARLGQEKQQRLFSSCSLFEFFRLYSGQLDWSQIGKLAQRYGLSESAYEGLIIGRELYTKEMVSSVVLDLLNYSGIRPRILEWARYGPDSLVYFTGFKRTFFYLLGLLSVDGIRAKSKYFIGSLVGDRSNKSIFFSFIPELVSSTISLLRNKETSTRDFAFWIESELPFEADPMENLQA